ncbi:helix-turn-helix domain-containing protein [Kineococcus sp. SYSU DK006]|uniref:helix-turn-helix domain-containing protein n=1 Tax=Kineococcus sp. SYSU DK006 TaxID=3383127 RepID=UPI003D7EE19E
MPLARVTALVGERVAPFELGIAVQVFGTDRRDDDPALPHPLFRVAAASPGPVPAAAGFDVLVHHGLEALADADLVVVPAWPALDAPVAEPVLEAVRAAVGRGARLLTICTGAFLAARAGLLDGRRATTHWQFTGLLAERHPRVRVEHDVLHVDDGPVTTSAGAAAGIDACLHVVRTEHGAAVANALARRMVTAAQRAGGQAQFVERPVPRSTAEPGIAELQDWARAHLHEPLTVDALARRALMSPRTFARRFREATGTTPHRWLVEERVRRAEELLESTDLTVEAIAARTGTGTAEALRAQFTARRGVGPATHRRTFRAPGTAGAAGPRG